MDKIEKAFADYFKNLEIRLPPGTSTLKKPGQISKAGWFISYVSATTIWIFSPIIE